MCGSGTIGLELMRYYPSAFSLNGDNEPAETSRTRRNLIEAKERYTLIGTTPFKSLVEGDRWSQGVGPFPAGIPSQEGNGALDGVRWDVTNLPLRTASVDVFVTDLPFGHKVGNKVNLALLYPQCMREISRILRPGTGRAVLLTSQHSLTRRVLKGPGSQKAWSNYNADPIAINMGGKQPVIYCLQRSEITFDEINV